MRIVLSVTILSASFSLWATNNQFIYSKYSTDLEVIEDRGGQSISKYLPTNNEAMTHVNESRLKKQKMTMFNNQFPVISKSLTVGRVTKEEARDINYQLASKPMFIIGYDAVSINWLKANKELLNDKGAIGLVVNIETKEQMEYLQKVVGKRVTMQPTQGDSLAKHLKIKHYPFYMDNKGVLR